LEIPGRIKHNAEIINQFINLVGDKDKVLIKEMQSS
jgi:hypothetical protein